MTEKEEEKNPQIEQFVKWLQQDWAHIAVLILAILLVVVLIVLLTRRR